MAASEDFDIESIAAFIDGRVTGIARDRVVKTLTESDAAFEIYAEALQTRADLIDGTVIPIAATRRRGPWLVAVPAAAAAILLVAVMPRMQVRHQRASLAAPVATIARPVLAVQAGLPIQVGEHNWKVSRGGGTVLVESTSVFRLGVRAADLHISLATGERDAAGRVTGEMVDLLQPIRISDAVRADYVDVRARIDGGYPTREILAVSDSAERRLAEFLGSTWFDVGKWFGAGEYAASIRADAFFASPTTARFLDWASEPGHLAQGDVDLLRRAATPPGKAISESDFEGIREAFAELIRRHAE